MIVGGWCKEELPKEGAGKLYRLARVLTSDLTTLLAHSGNAIFVDPTRTCGAPPRQLLRRLLVRVILSLANMFAKCLRH